MKRVLDMCCGPRCFYFDKADTRVLACDVRTVNFTNQLNRTCIVAPDLLQDFRHLPEEWSGRFDLVLFDPPHLAHAGEKSWLRAKYGVLDRTNWRADLAAGFAEGFRVLREGGTLLFKWAETQIKVSEVLKLTEQKPLIATRFPTKSGTHWMVFYKEAA